MFKIKMSHHDFHLSYILDTSERVKAQILILDAYFFMNETLHITRTTMSLYQMIVINISTFHG